MRGTRSPTVEAETEPAVEVQGSTSGGATATVAVRPRRPTRERAGPREPAGPLVLGRYRLHRRLGTGAFGTVWQARDERLDRDVAVKIVPRERVVGGRFEREARAAARLQHPAIVTLYEAGADDDGAYLVSELVRGRTLDAVLAAGRLSDRDIVVIGVSLCDALMHAHSEGVVHRDVKPSNILVCDRSSASGHPAKLTDFGVARVVGGDTLTRTGDVVGTAAYMAPEQAEGREASAAADLYSLALVLYESLTGVNPLRSISVQRARRLAVHLPPLRRQRRELPRELGRAIDLALRPRTRERGTIDDLRRSLLAVLDELDQTPGVVGAPWRPPTLRSGPGSAGPRRDPPTSAGAHAGALEPDAGSEPAGGATWVWPERALGAVAGAAGFWWLAASAPIGLPVAPPATALLAAVLLLFLPRLGWLTLALLLAIAALLSHHPGTALVILPMMAIPTALLPRAPRAWPLAAATPLVGVVALAGAWPALAARARGSWRRAALAAAGWGWLALAGPLAGRPLYIPVHAPRRAVWTPSLYEALHHVLVPLLSSGVLAGALVWAAGAALLPPLVRGRALGFAAPAAVLWTTIVVVGTLWFAPGVHQGVALAGAFAAVAVALARRPRGLP